MNNVKRRWYDENNSTDTFEQLKSLDSDSQKVLASNLTEIIRQIKDLHREEVEPNLSLGLERVIGLYHQVTNSRRWYDADDEFSYALKTLFTLPEEDFLNIVEGLSVSLHT